MDTSENILETITQGIGYALVGGIWWLAAWFYWNIYQHVTGKHHK